MCIVLGCTIFLFLYGSIWYMVFLFFFFWFFNYYLYFCRFIFILFFFSYSCFLHDLLYFRFLSFLVLFCYNIFFFVGKKWGLVGFRIYWIYMCIVLGCTIFLFLYGSIWYMVFLFFFFWLFNYYLYFCRFIFILFFFCVLASSTIFYIFVCFHPGFNPLSSICFLYRSSVFSMPLCFSLASPFLFPVLVFSLFAKFLIYHECMHDCCLEIHCALIRIAIAYYK